MGDTSYPRKITTDQPLADYISWVKLLVRKQTQEIKKRIEMIRKSKEHPSNYFQQAES